MFGSSKKVTVGYKYYLGIHLILCHGPIDRITRAYVDNRVAWTGSCEGGPITISAEELFGGEEREGGVSGQIDVEPGRPDQDINPYLQDQLGPDIPAFRGVLGLIYRQVYLGMNPYLKPWKFRASRIFTRQDGIDQWYPSKAGIGYGNTNADTQYSEVEEVVLASEMVLDSTFDCAENGEFNPLIGKNISGVLETDVIVVSKVENPEELAWSPWLEDDLSPDGFAWTNRIKVTQENEITTWSFNGSLYSTPESAHSAFGSFEVTGSTKYYFWLQDGGQKNDNRGGVSLRIVRRRLVTKSESHLDMNPSHIIRECLTDPDWGMGYPESTAGPSFTTAADKLYDEGMGMSLIWDREMPIEDFVAEITRHIDAALYMDKSTGQFTLKLIRDDLEESSMLTLDPSNISKVSKYKVTDPGELINKVNVNYWDAVTGETASVSAEDISAIQAYGSVVSTTIQYPGFTNARIASRVAERDLKALSTPLLNCTLEADRNAADLNIGDAFKFVWPQKHEGYIVMRVNDISYGDGLNNKVNIVCSQDIYSLPDTAALGEEESGWEDPIITPQDSEIRLVEEVSYYELILNQGQSETETLLNDNPDVGYLSTTCSRVESGINYSCAVDNGAGYEIVHRGDFAPVGTMPSSLPTENTFTLTGVVDSDSIELNTYAHWGDELVVVTGWEPPLLTVGRGVLDSVPYRHEQPEPIIFSDLFLEGGSNEYVASESLDVKLLTKTGRGTLPLTEASINNITMDSRANRPYPPGLFRVNLTPFLEWESSSQDLSISWTHRDRTQQTSGTFFSHSAGDIGPEPGTTYNLRFYGEDDTLGREVLGVTGTSYTYLVEDEKTDFLIPASSGSGPVTSIDKTELRAYWSLDEGTGTTVTDEHNSITGTATSGSLWEASSKINSGIEGTNVDYIELAETNNLLNLTDDAFMWFWVKQDSLDTAHILDLGSSYSGTGSSNQGLYFAISSGRPRFRVRTGMADGYGGDSRGRWAADITIKAGVWNLVFMWRTNTNAYARIYNEDGIFNDELDLGGSYPLNDWSTRRNFIGALTTSGSDDSPSILNAGTHIDEIGVLANIPSEAEMESLWNDGSGFAYPLNAAGGDYRINGRLRIELESQRDGYTSFRKYNHEILREGYGFNYGKLYGGGN